jgi:predicted RNA-binding protein with TRAM domain
MARRKREPETAAIESATHDGRGIAAVTGKKVFVAGALKGETVRFQRRKRRRNYDEAELLEVLEASPARIEPRCAVFGRCGGCSLQHISQDSQRDIKQQTLADSLARIGQVEPAEWLAPLFDADGYGGWHYRRRARLAVKDVAAAPGWGFSPPPKIACDVLGEFSHTSAANRQVAVLRIRSTLVFSAPSPDGRPSVGDRSFVRGVTRPLCNSVRAAVR